MHLEMVRCVAIKRKKTAYKRNILLGRNNRLNRIRELFRTGLTGRWLEGDFPKLASPRQGESNRSR
jgi:hypothetical protein